jgi:hypothetical protein
MDQSKDLAATAQFLDQAIGAPASSGRGQEEIARLKCEVARLKAERDILKRAAPWR